LPHAFTYRFKVIKRSEPVRTERIGPFEIDTVASYFYYVEGADRLAASATYRLRHHGQAIPGIAAADAIAVVAAGSAKPVLFVTIADPGDGLPCALVIDEGTTVRVQRVTGCAAPASTWLLTSDQAHFETARARKLLPGWIDRSSFAAPGLFVVRGAVIDTRDLTTAAFEWPMDARVDTDIPPLDLSPDERSFVWLAHESSEAGTRLGVTDWRANRSYFLPIDRTRMRYPTESALDPTWVRHHFEWRRGADGIDTLTERANVVPLAHRGDLTLTKPGDALFAVP
jgi:hypothetical protein